MYPNTCQIKESVQGMSEITHVAHVQLLFIHYICSSFMNDSRETHSIKVLLQAFKTFYFSYTVRTAFLIMGKQRCSRHWLLAFSYNFYGVFAAYYVVFIMFFIRRSLVCKRAQMYLWCSSPFHISIYRGSLQNHDDSDGWQASEIAAVVCTFRGCGLPTRIH